MFGLVTPGSKRWTGPEIIHPPSKPRPCSAVFTLYLICRRLRYADCRLSTSLRPNTVTAVWQWEFYKYVRITTYQPDNKSKPNPKPNPKPITKEYAIVIIHLNIVTCPTYPHKFIRDSVVAPSVPLFDYTLPSCLVTVGYGQTFQWLLRVLRLFWTTPKMQSAFPVSR